LRDLVPTLIGVDVGGTKCLGVVLSADHEVQATARRPTATSFDDLSDTVAAVVEELEGGAAEQSPIGVGLPGLVDRDGRLHAAPHLDDPGGHEPIAAAAALSDRLNRRVLLDNDATCATLAEWQLGAGRGLNNFVLVTLGTGIGGGVVSDGAVMRGEHGFVGEFGHMLVDPDGPACSCGNRGCWETFASGRALGDLARAAAERGGLDGVLAAVGGDLDRVGGEQLEDAARRGDAGAAAVLDEFAHWIGVGLAALTNAFDPAAFVLGGGLAGTADVLAGPLERWLREFLYSSRRRPVPEVRFAALGPMAGAMGAALLTAPGRRS
jgi:glucokinase